MLGVLLTLCVIMVLLLPMPANRKDGSSVSGVQWCVVGPYGGDKVCTGSLSSPLTSRLHTLGHIKKKQICALTFVCGITIAAVQLLLSRTTTLYSPPPTSPPPLSSSFFTTSVLLTVRTKLL